MKWKWIMNMTVAEHSTFINTLFCILDEKIIFANGVKRITIASVSEAIVINCQYRVL